MLKLNKAVSGTVALLGRPNSGKSTLFNTLVGVPLAIVTPLPHTTRDRLKGACDVERFVPGASSSELIMVDLPGVLPDANTPGSAIRTGRALDRHFNHEVQRALEHPHAVWWLVSPKIDAAKEAPVIARLKTLSCPIILVETKSDVRSQKQTSLLEALGPVAEGLAIHRRIAVSARTSEGLSELLEQTLELLPPRSEDSKPFFRDAEALTDRPMRYFASEAIRKQLFLQLHEEVPYGCAVRITNFDESKTPIRIEGDICVERESQRAMVVGKGGQRIKEIGMKARKDIESLLEVKQIYLGLRVVVQKEWTHREDLVKALGYGNHA